MTFPSKEILELLRRQYPEGTRIELIHMDDPYNKKLVSGNRGTVRFVDAAGTLQMDWDCGSSLGLIPGTDSFRIIDEEDKNMTEEMKKALLDLRARQESGEHIPCPRCGRDTMKPKLHTNALSRHAEGIYVCDECGTSEAMLNFMNNPMPIEDWALFNPQSHSDDFKDTPGEEAWEQLQKEQTQILAELFLDWLNGKGDRNFKAYRREAMRRCLGLSFLFDRPFSAVYKVAEGDLILRFKNTGEGVKISKDILRFMK